MTHCSLGTFGFKEDSSVSNFLGHREAEKGLGLARLVGRGPGGARPGLLLPTSAQHPLCLGQHFHGGWSGMLWKLLAAPQPCSTVCRDFLGAICSLPPPGPQHLALGPPAPTQRALHVPAGQTADAELLSDPPQTVAPLPSPLAGALSLYGCDSSAEVCSLGSTDSRQGGPDLGSQA